VSGGTPPSFFALNRNFQSHCSSLTRLHDKREEHHEQEHASARRRGGDRSSCVHPLPWQILLPQRSGLKHGNGRLQPDDTLMKPLEEK